MNDFEKNVRRVMRYMNSLELTPIEKRSICKAIMEIAEEEALEKARTHPAQRRL